MGPHLIANAKQQLSRVDVLSKLTPAELAELQPQIKFRPYESEETIVAFEDESNDFCMLLSGAVLVTIYSRNGREITFRELKAGDSFGELAAIDGAPRSANVIALDTTVIGSLSASQFRMALRRYPSLMEATLNKLVYLVRSLSERVAEFSWPAEARVAAALERIGRGVSADGKTACIRPRPNNGHVASLISTQREQVSRTISKLAQSGIIVKRPGELVIMDLHGLAEWARQLDDS
jgi:CRP-like cAMP-binding protein